MTGAPSDNQTAPKLARDGADRAARLRRMIVMPIIIVAIAVAMWWWSNREMIRRHNALHDSVAAMVQGHLRQTSTAPTMMRLRWSEPAMQSVLLAGLADLAPSGRSPRIVVRTDLSEADGLTPVEVRGSSGTVVLMIRPVDDLSLGVIQSVARGP